MLKLKVAQIFANVAKAVFIWKGTFFKIALKSLNIWATFKTKYFTQNFRKSSILVTLCVISSTYLPTYSWYFFQKRLPYLQSRYLTHLSKHFIRWSRRPCWTKEGPQSKGLQDWLYNILDCLPIHQSEVLYLGRCHRLCWGLISLRETEMVLLSIKRHHRRARHNHYKNFFLYLIDLKIMAKLFGF